MLIFAFSVKNGYNDSILIKQWKNYECVKKLTNETSYPTYSPDIPSFLITFLIAWRLVLCSFALPPSPWERWVERNKININDPEEILTYQSI